MFGGPFPYGEIAALARTALDQGESVLMILQKQRLERMRGRLGSSRRVTYVDTREALRAMTADGKLVDDLVVGTLGPLLAKAAERGNGRVAIYTDAAGTLVLDGRLADSRKLETLCHGVCARSPVFLICVYPVKAYSQLGTFVQAFREEHALAVP